jgi:membrane-associated protein
MEKRLGAAREYFDRRGGLTVAVGRLATAAGTFVPFTAGLARMPYPRFLAWNIPAIAVWAVGVALLGYFFGKNLDLVDRILTRYGWIAAGALVALVVGRWAWKRARKG